MTTVRPLAIAPAYWGYVSRPRGLPGVCACVPAGLPLAVRMLSRRLGSGCVHAGRGLEILSPGAGFAMDVFVGLPAWLHAGLGEQLFARWQ